MTEKCGCGGVSGCRHAPLECSGEAVTIERPHGMRVPLCRECVTTWGVTLANGGRETSRSAEAAAGKTQAERALRNLRAIGVVPQAAPVDKVTELLSAMAGVAKFVKAMPAATTQQAIDQAVMIEGAFLALAHAGGGRIAIEAVVPLLDLYRRNLKKRHVTDYGRLRHLELAVQHVDDPARLEAILHDHLAAIEKLQKAPAGSVS